MLPRGLPLMYVIVVAIAIIGIYISGTQLYEFQGRAGTAQALHESADRLFIATLNTETGQRGFLLTGREAYLEPYFKGRDVQKAEIDALSHMSLTAEQSQFVDTLSPLMEAKTAEVRQSIELRQRGQVSAAQKIVQTDTGKILMDKMRTLFMAERMRSEKDRAFLRTKIIWWAQGMIYSLILGLSAAFMLFMASTPKRAEEVSDTQAITWEDF